MRGIYGCIVVLAIILLSVPLALGSANCVKPAGAGLLMLVEAPQQPIYKGDISEFTLTLKDAQGTVFTESFEAQVWFSKDGKTKFSQKYIVVDGKIKLRYQFKEPGFYSLRLRWERADQVNEAEAYRFVVQERPRGRLFWLVLGAILGAAGLFAAQKRMRRRKHHRG